jgi:hypothetical protein
MDSEQDRSDDAVPEPPGWVVPPAKKKGRGAGVFLLRLGIGAAVSFTVLSLLYGVNQAGMIVGLAVICTAGLGLIPILFLSWIVGWIVIAAMEAITARPGAPEVP